ncbi:YkvA family protein [Hugenholtzia roseola]|uniref:YkvA family protein n=1 Tax=Hugenholtzia roseola TaxID=1002 RepID=UPI0006846026|nr:YkvA family protein [Hugenholtzia roseola]
MSSPLHDEPKYVTGSPFFKKALKKAFDVAANQNKALKLAKAVMDKAAGGSINSLGKDLKEKVFLLVRMVKALVTGRYKNLPINTLVRIVAVLIYFVSPIDLLPDFLPFLGFADDITLIVWLLDSINQDVIQFEAWEKEQKLLEN